jgi:hypothetical protein
MRLRRDLDQLVRIGIVTRRKSRLRKMTALRTTL